MDTTNTPESPPAAPVVPVGLGTKLGVAGTVLLGLVAVAGPVIDGFGADESAIFGGLATLLVAVTILGRMLQAAAAMLAGERLPVEYGELREGVPGWLAAATGPGAPGTTGAVLDTPGAPTVTTPEFAFGGTAPPGGSIFDEVDDDPEPEPDEVDDNGEPITFEPMSDRDAQATAGRVESELRARGLTPANHAAGNPGEGE